MSVLPLCAGVRSSRPFGRSAAVQPRSQGELRRWGLGRVRRPRRTTSRRLLRYEPRIDLRQGLPSVAEPKFLLPSCGFAWGGRHGQADQRVAAAELHGRVHRERHIRRNPAPLSRRANLVRAGASFVEIAFAVLAACPFRGRAEKRAAGKVPPLVVSGRAAAPNVENGSGGTDAGSARG